MDMDALAARIRARRDGKALIVEYVNLNGETNRYHAATIEQRNAFLEKLRLQGRKPL